MNLKVHSRWGEGGAVSLGGEQVAGFKRGKKVVGGVGRVKRET